MSIETKLYLLTAGLTVGTLIAAWQAFMLRKVYRSASSWIGMVTFILWGAKQLYGMARLRSSIAEAKTRGVMIDHLSLEQWIVGVAWSYVIVIGFILWQHWQHRNLNRLGI